jgi:phosphohistidine phosphatase SixA
MKTNPNWCIPPSMLHWLERIPTDRPVVLLLRHSVREDLPEGDAGYTIPITDVGRDLAHEMGVLLRGRLRTLHTSPILRCGQTVNELNAGSKAKLKIQKDTLLGDPGIFVNDSSKAGAIWKALGHEAVMAHLVSTEEPLPGLANAGIAARFLVQHMLTAAGESPGVHIFCTHDSLVTATAAHLLGLPLKMEDWPWYLEGAFFWQDGSKLKIAYQSRGSEHHSQLSTLCEADVLEFARREIASTIGFDSGARFFLAGGAFKTLLTGHPPRDLDLWAPSEEDRERLIAALERRNAKRLPERAYTDAWSIGNRIVELPHKTEPATLEARLSRFDLALSAVGVEHCPDGTFSALIHPLAIESAIRKEVLLLKPLINWRHSLATLERMRRYAAELGFSSPESEEREIWKIFESQTPEMCLGMLERFHRTSKGGFGVAEEVAGRRKRE